MEILAFLSFGALVVAWLVAPSRDTVVAVKPVESRKAA